MIALLPCQLYSATPISKPLPAYIFTESDYICFKSLTTCPTIHFYTQNLTGVILTDAPHPYNTLSSSLLVSVAFPVNAYLNDYS